MQMVTHSHVLVLDEGAARPVAQCWRKSVVTSITQYHSGRMIKRTVCLPALMWSIKYPCQVHVCSLGAMTCLNTKGRALGG
jgi:hypothetical protein